MDKRYDRIFGQNIRRLRNLAGITQEQLAARMQIDGCDITRSALAKIEAGQRHLYPDEIKSVRRVLKVEYDDLFVEDKDSEKMPEK